MILDGPDKGDWIGYCAGCDWQIGPRPVDPSLGEEVREHERLGNLAARAAPSNAVVSRHRGEAPHPWTCAWCGKANDHLGVVCVRCSHYGQPPKKETDRA